MYILATHETQLIIYIFVLYIAHIQLLQDSVYDITLSSLMNCMSSTCMSISFTSDNPLYKACSVMCFSANAVAVKCHCIGLVLYYSLINCLLQQRKRADESQYVRNFA